MNKKGHFWETADHNTVLNEVALLKVPCHCLASFKGRKNKRKGQYARGATRKGCKCKWGTLPWPAWDGFCLNTARDREFNLNPSREKNALPFLVENEWTDFGAGTDFPPTLPGSFFCGRRQIPSQSCSQPERSVKSKEEPWQKVVGGSSEALECSSKASDSKTHRKWHDKRLPWKGSSACSQGSCWSSCSLSAQVVPPQWDLGSVRGSWEWEGKGSLSFLALGKHLVWVVFRS